MADSVQVNIDPGVYAMNSVQIIGGDEDSLRDFISRWFNPLYPGATTEAETTIWMGELPDEFPIAFPLPNDSMVIASVQNALMSLSVILDVSLPLNDTLTAYNQVLEDAGWNLAPDNSQGSGFIQGYAPWFTFCNDQVEAVLSLQAYPIEEQNTEIRLDLYTENIKYTCDPNTYNQMDQTYEILPVLRLPSGALKLGGGSSISDGQAENSSDIRTELTLTELMDHLLPQMETAGWRLLDEIRQEDFVWSSWSFTDDQKDTWGGALLLIKDPAAENRLFVLVRAVRITQ